MQTSKNIYKVGGAVRDKVLNEVFMRGIVSHDTDWVCTGYTPEEMLQLGFKQVGRAFPVFLHPDTGEEFALARTEVSTGSKHTDYVFKFDETVTIEEDLLRRDFTMNAIAEGGYSLTVKDSIPAVEQIGELYYIDPLNGITDIKNKIVRMTERSAFMTDPLRALRGCRFTTQLGFTMEPNTVRAIKEMVEGDAIQHLPKERILSEIEKGFATTAGRFIMLLDEVGILKVILPEVALLKDTPENTKYHTSPTTFGHVIKAVERVEHCKPAIIWATLLHDIGKGNAYLKSKSILLDFLRKNDLQDKYNIDTDLYQIRELAKQSGIRYFIPHDDLFAERTLNEISMRLGFTSYTYTLCKDVIRHHMRVWKLFDGMRPEKIYDIVKAITRNFQRGEDTEYVNNFLTVIEADNQSDHVEKEAERIALLKVLIKTAIQECNKAKPSDIEGFDSLPNVEKGIALSKLRKSRIKMALTKYLH